MKCNDSTPEYTAAEFADDMCRMLAAHRPAGALDECHICGAPTAHIATSSFVLVGNDGEPPVQVIVSLCDEHKDVTELESVPGKLTMLRVPVLEEHRYVAIATVTVDSYTHFQQTHASEYGPAPYLRRVLHCDREFMVGARWKPESMAIRMLERGGKDIDIVPVFCAWGDGDGVVMEPVEAMKNLLGGQVMTDGKDPDYFVAGLPGADEPGGFIGWMDSHFQMPDNVRFMFELPGGDVASMSRRERRAAARKGRKS